MKTETRDVFAVVWTGECYGNVTRPFYDIEFFGDLRSARDCVAEFIKKDGVRNWTCTETGLVYFRRDQNCYVSIIGDEVDFAG